ncbi:hypothetical protein ACTXJC_16720 [Glutamicibacter ardleyensis]
MREEILTLDKGEPVAMFGASTEVTKAPNGDEVASDVESTFNDLWSSVIASDPQTQKTLYVVGLIIVLCAVCGGLFTIKKGWKRAGVGILLACIPGIFLMYPQEVLTAVLGFLGILWGFLLRLFEFVSNR